MFENVSNLSVNLHNLQFRRHLQVCRLERNIPFGKLNGSTSQAELSQTPDGYFVCLGWSLSTVHPVKWDFIYLYFDGSVICTTILCLSILLDGTI